MTDPEDIPFIPAPAQTGGADEQNNAAARPHAKRWCFTCYDVNPPPFVDSAMDFMIRQQEQCPDTGRRHWQGYVVFTQKQRLGKKSDSGVKQYLGPTTHVEIARGSVRDNINYCSKDKSAIIGTTQSFGEIPMEEAKHEFRSLHEDIKNPNLKRVDILERNLPLYVKHGKNVDALYTALRAEANVPRTVYNVCFWGGTGTGKTSWTLDEFGTEVYRKSKGDHWWDNYDGQSVVLWDDFYGEQKVSDMFNNLDMYTHQVQVKGGTVIIRQHINVLTSNTHPDMWYKTPFEGRPDLHAAWKRRLPDSNIFETRWEWMPGRYIDSMTQEPDYKRLNIRSSIWPESRHSWHEMPSWDELSKELTPLVPRTKPTPDERTRQREEEYHN